MRRLLSLFAVGLMAAACGGIGAPGFTLPPINLQSLPPFVLPSGIIGGSGDCPFVTPAEVTSIMGSTPTISNYSDGDCSFTFSNLGTVVVSTESDTDLATAKAGLGQSAKDITVGNLPGVSGTVPFINQPIVYVQLGADQLQVLGVLLPNDDATINKLVQVATIAASHAGT
jgi:hypothetical protein